MHIVAARHAQLTEQLAEITSGQRRAPSRSGKVPGLAAGQRRRRVGRNSRLTAIETLVATRDIRDLMTTARTGGCLGALALDAGRSWRYGATLKMVAVAQVTMMADFLLRSNACSSAGRLSPPVKVVWRQRRPDLTPASAARPQARPAGVGRHRRRARARCDDGAQLSCEPATAS